MKTIDFILPIYNEADSIIELYREICKVKIFFKKKYSINIIFIDDGSNDKSSFILRSLSSKEKNIRLITFIKNYGKTNAIKAGLKESSADIVILMDTDLQDNPIYLIKMLPLIEKYDFVIGNRINRYKNNIYKKLSSSFISSLLTNVFPSFEIHDVNCGIKVIRKEVFKNIYLNSDYHRYIPLITYLNGFKVKEVNILQRVRKHGESKYGKTGFNRLINSFTDLIAIVLSMIFLKKPFSFFGKTGLFFLFIGFLILLYLTAKWFLGTPIQSRPLFFLGILLTTTGINLISLGLIGEQIKIYNSDQDYIIK